MKLLNRILMSTGIILLPAAPVLPADMRGKNRITKLVIPCFLFIIMIMLSGCVHIRMTHLDDEELAWIENFNRYTTCRFISNNGSQSTLAVKHIGVWNSTNPFFIGSNESFDYEAATSVAFEILQNDRILDGLFRLKKVLPERSLEVLAWLGDRFSDENIKLHIREFEYDGRRFKECVILDSWNSHIVQSHYPYESDVSKMVFSKEYGLIYYSFSDGEEFFRVDD